MSKSPFRPEDLSSAKALLEKGDVRNVLFSGPTYQVEVLDAACEDPYWIFLQVKTNGQPGDFFCSCPDFEESGSCKHIAAAYLQIFNNQKRALHTRFDSSLFNKLCLMASHRHGYSEKDLDREELPWSCKSQSGKTLFTIEPINEEGKQILDEIICNRQEETEETSIKFSNLSSDELHSWRKGRPSHALRYELSFWSDLGKWFAWLFEKGEKFEIKFHGEGLPSEIELIFPQVRARFFIAEVNWPDILPTLVDLPTPIPVHAFQEIQIKEITYDETERAFKIHASSVAPRKESGQEIELDDWAYTPGVAFYKKDIDPLLQKEVIDEDHVEEMLRSYPVLLEKYLKNVALHRERKSANYQLYFDNTDRLHISCYVFEPGDLLKEKSHLFGSWAYLEGRGFYRLQELLFDTAKKVIERDQISEFINHHKVWLNQHEGFQTHLTSIESQIGFHLHPNGDLEFSAEDTMTSESKALRDFGDWVYIEHQGFYSKGSTRTAKVIKPGLRIARDEVSAFLQAHRAELEQVKGFFTTNSPVQHSGINLTVSRDGNILVDPNYLFHKDYKDHEPLLYGDFFYVKKEGFSDIPSNLRLPKGYEKAHEIKKDQESYFINFELDKLKPFFMDVDPHLIRPDRMSLQLSQIKQDPVTGNWLVSLSYKTEVGVFPAALVWRGISERKSYLMTKAGLLFIKQPRFDWLAHLDRESLSASGQQFQLSTIELLRLKAFEDIQVAKGSDPGSIKILEELEGNTNFDEQSLPELKGFKSTLRPYQEVGLKWLWFLYQFGMSGILCDEMGLGKTHQAMALICAIHTIDEGKRKRFLVVCPTSVIYHWEELLEKFLPNMRVLTFYGANRSLARFRKSSHILLTSYGTLRSEKDTFSRMNFELVVFDEMQVAKNRSSQVHKALQEVNAKLKLGLTGTPIENYLRELKALFDIVLPKYFPSDTAFRELFVTPIEKQKDSAKKALLAKLIKPFIMRRKKTEVLDDLPEKIEEIAHCDLSTDQQELYRVAYTQQKEQIDAIADPDSSDFYIHVFALLNALKQICNHPALYNKDTKNYEKYGCGKWDLFTELLQEARESGQKVVVFSQYLGMLDIIEAHLDKEGIGHAGIRGSTKDRKGEVDKFRHDPKCEVFVASLQAAGVGIDLVSASVVIHYDRWWNPAKEDQATDRVHRIGQNRGVQVFKLVSKHSVEEHIDELILKKRALISSIIGYDDQDELKALSRDELVELLTYIGKDLG
ncbi:MAG: DEAD/DEAH box helicase [Simkaniaceae bacterium]|nr:DEAD/DEAH box helicase [Simkaniaceae bacterium]